MEEESEEKLIGEYREGSERALEKIFQNNSKLIHFIYERDFKLSGCPSEDMFQEGCIGLMEAVKRFKPELAAQFNSYKTLWIKKRMFDFRKKYFKVRFAPINSKYNNAVYDRGRSGNLREMIFDLDNLISSGKLKGRKANLILAKIKGKSK